MQRRQLSFRKGFRVVAGNRKAQAAEMSIAPGDSEGGPGNRHRGADQWMFVVEGSGVVISGRRRLKLGAGTLVLIGKGEVHEVRNAGRTLLRTLNVYVPPAYGEDGEALPRGRR